MSRTRPGRSAALNRSTTGETVMRHSATCVRPPVWRMCARCIGADQGLIMADPLSRGSAIKTSALGGNFHWTDTSSSPGNSTRHLAKDLGAPVRSAARALCRSGSGRLYRSGRADHWAKPRRRSDARPNEDWDSKRWARGRQALAASIRTDYVVVAAALRFGPLTSGF